MKPFYRISAILCSLLLVLSFASCSLLGGNRTYGGTTSNEELNQPTYTITYDFGVGTSTTVTYRSTDPDYVPDEPVRAGYRFLWWTLDGKEEHYNGVVQSGSSGDITFRAVWEPIEYTLTYLGADGTSNPATYTVESDSFTLSIPEKAGYYFLGWHSQDGQLKKEMTVPKGSTGDLVFTAEWSATRFDFSASASADVPITVSIGEEYLRTDTPIRVTAPVYTSDMMFSHWELNGTKVSETVFYSFPMPSKDTEIKAIYKTLTVVSYDKASGAAQSVLLSSRPTFCLGGNAETGTDITLNDSGVTFSADYLASLDPGDYRFCAATETNGEITFTLRVTDRANAPKSEPDYAGLTGTAKTYYEMPTFTYRGKTYHRVVSTEAEFRAMVEYFIFVEGALQMQRDNNKEKGYPFDFYLLGDFQKLSGRVSEISFPMRPKLSYHRKPSGAGEIVTLTVQYQDGLNSEVSAQPPDPIGDRQKLLTSAGRSDNYNDFKIDALTKTVEIRTLYELEVLPFGRKPTFAASAAEAQAVYNEARTILRTIIDDGMDDYAKVAAIYAWLGENLTYDKAAASSESSVYSAYTVKGALIDRIAVCDGYASAFRLLCQIEGIRAEEVTGMCEQQGMLGGHAWNKVWIGGAVFGVDSTWARPVGSDFITLQYLFLSESDLLAQKHYENTSSEVSTPRAATLADANVFLPKAVVFSYGTLGLSKYYDFSIDSESEFQAMVTYLKDNQIAAAEFYNNSSKTFSSGLSYNVYWLFVNSWGEKNLTKR